MPARIKPQVSTVAIDKIAIPLNSKAPLGTIASNAEQILVSMTPVDSGVLRANWFVSQTKGDPKVDLSKTAHERSKVSGKGLDVLYLINNVDYVLYANETSYSPEFIEKSVARINEVISNYGIKDVI